MLHIQLKGPPAINAMRVILFILEVEQRPLQWPLWIIPLVLSMSKMDPALEQIASSNVEKHESNANQS